MTGRPSSSRGWQCDCAPVFVYCIMSSVQCQGGCASRAVQQRPAFGVVGTVEHIVMQHETYSLEFVIAVQENGRQGRDTTHTESRFHAVSNIGKRVVYSLTWRRKLAARFGMRGCVEATGTERGIGRWASLARRLLGIRSKGICEFLKPYSTAGGRLPTEPRTKS